MKQPISTHVKCIPRVVLGLLYVMVWIAAIALALPDFALCCVLPMFLCVVPPVAIIGLGEIPVYSLDIYEDGFRSRTFWILSEWWSWSEIETLKAINRRDIVTYQKLWLENVNGKAIKLRGLTDWPQACYLIVARAAPVVYEKSLNALNQGNYLFVSDDLSFGQNGICYLGCDIGWQDIDFVDLENEGIEIGSPLLDTPQQTISLDKGTTRNGIVYGVLLYEIWQEATQIPLESVEFLIEGIGFNSEGEIVGFEQAASKEQEERI